MTSIPRRNCLEFTLEFEAKVTRTEVVGVDVERRTGGRILGNRVGAIEDVVDEHGQRAKGPGQRCAKIKLARGLVGKGRGICRI